MSVSQMLWHVNEALQGALLTVPEAPESVPLPRPLLKFLVINLPWVRGANWVDSPTLGPMSGKEVSRLQAKHLNHHLTQFGV